MPHDCLVDTTHMRDRYGLSLILMLGLLPLLSGCSTLGLGSRPVAHVLTNEARDMLDQSSSRPNVPTELSKQVLPNHTLQPGDAVLVESLDESTRMRIPADQTVMPDGTIDLGPLGRLVVAAMTLEQAEATIQQLAATHGHGSATVSVRLIQPVHRFYVVGEVNSPGSYPLVGHESVLDALMKAGGLTDDASACDILLARPTTTKSCRVTLPVCYRAITQLGDTSTNYHLQPGDRIVVARQGKFEEVFGFLSLPFACPHCSCPEKACCDPNAATYPGSEFVPTGPNHYPSVQPPRVPKAPQSDTTTYPQQGVRLLTPETFEAQPGTAADGELDFGSDFSMPRSR
ncbi:MAG: polysaccharide biosynthesis/export family protein [Planctomycetaceae bacterium]